MGIELCYSDHIETLAGKLADDLRGGSLGRDPFIKPVVMVVNPNVAKWLQMEIASRNTVAANIDYPYLEKGLWNILASCDPGEKKPRLLKSEKYQFLVLSLLLGSRRDEPEIGPLLNYLYDASGAESADYSRRAWQLSEHLASVLREYEYNREDMVRCWLEDKLLYKDDAKASSNIKEMEAAQRAVYRRIFGEGGIRDALRDKTGELLLTLPQYERR
ncbi:MAG: exodeoxyribonuclease V subunit gamma, partial [Candidatus Omnitrophica bacterium]|nr:exodeoxyribonuclease V subunit gamma [Candidatus Omnitrophota bacterium]